MLRSDGRLGAGFAALWIASSVALGDDGPTRNVPGWAEVVDPSRDCKVALDAARDRLTIAIPGTPHLLSSEVAGLAMGAPRVVREFEGDFKVSVRVAGKLDPGASKSTAFDPYHGAGLIVWKDERTYLRVERAVGTIHGRATPYNNYELREGGRLAFSHGLATADHPLYLKIERAGGQIRAWRGDDGSRWVELPASPSMTGRVRVGVVAINSALHPLRAELDHFRLENPGDAGESVDSKAMTTPSPAMAAGGRSEGK